MNLKTSKTAFLTILLSLSATSAIADTTRPVINCHQKHLRDAGEVVSIQAITGTEGGVRYKARGGQDSIIGVQEYYLVDASIRSVGNVRQIVRYEVDGQEYVLSYRLVFGDKEATLTIDGGEALEMDCAIPAIEPIRFVPRSESDLVEIASMNDFRAREQGPLTTCMAYFTGYVFNVGNGTCEEKSESGCSNPFAHNTYESCMNAALVLY